MRYLSISEFAKMFDVSRQTLIYYDQVGLFKPYYRDPDTNYRYYTYNQFSQFSFIKFLRNLGFSIDKVKSLLNDSDLNDLKTDLDKRSMEIIRENKRLEEINSTIQRKLDFVEDKLSLSKNSTYDFFKAPARIYYALGYEENIYNNSLFFNYPTIVLYKFENNAYKKKFGALVDYKYVKDEYKSYISPVDKFDCVRFFYRGPYEDIPKRVEAVAEELGDIRFSKDFVCINIIDPFLENDSNKFLTEIQLPILEK